MNNIYTTEELPVPQRHAGGFVYSDETEGVLDGQRLPREIVTAREGGDAEVRAAARAMLSAAPIGAVYEVTRECRPDEDEPFIYSAYRKVGPNEWELVA